MRQPTLYTTSTPPAYIMKLQNSFYAIAAVQGLSASAVSAPESLHAHSIRGTPATWTVGQAVNTSSGVIIGHPASNRTDVSEYLGIPFAQPPVGNLRFAAPVPFQGNGSSIIAAQYVCIQDILSEIILTRRNSHRKQNRRALLSLPLLHPLTNHLVIVLEIPSHAPN
jgi:hypothetical protein